MPLHGDDDLEVNEFWRCFTGEPKGQHESLRVSKQAEEKAKADAARQEQIFNQISPFATALMGLGIDPRQFASSPLGQSILSQGRQGISENFQGARNNLAENLGASGLTGSGVGVGPLANLFSDEAAQQAQLIQNLPMQGLNLGLTGSNILTGQQQIFNPNISRGQALSGFTSIPRGGFWDAFTQSFGQSLGQTAGGQGFSLGQSPAPVSNPQQVRWP